MAQPIEKKLKADTLFCRGLKVKPACYSPHMECMVAEKFKALNKHELLK